MVKVTKHGGSLSHHRKRGFVLHNTVVKKHTHTFFFFFWQTCLRRSQEKRQVNRFLGGAFIIGERDGGNMRCRKISLRGSSSSIVHVQRDGLLYSCGRSTSPPHLPKGLTKGGEKGGSSFAKQIAQKKIFTRADMKFEKKKKKNNPAKFIALFRACTRNMSVNEPFYHTSCLFLFSIGYYLLQED